MILNYIEIKNYRSIDTLKIETSELLDKSYTYSLVGINEAGKSSILKAIALKDNITAIKPSIKDFREPNLPIEVVYDYNLTKNEGKELQALLKEGLPDEKHLSKLSFNNIELKIRLLKEKLQSLDFECCISSESEFDVDTLEKIRGISLKFLRVKSFKTIFWTSDSKYLISNPINIQNFAANPGNISVPLENCFKLARISNIQEQITLLSDSTERELLQETLGEKVTEHINKVWTKHPIKISFNISDNLINFHVKDLNSKSKAKTANQRSEGFRQFISFLLTISAQHLNGELTNTILLIDEPETHLHPKAQKDLLGELIKITKSKKDNILFFATHSNYMIDKNFLSRNIKVEKNKDETTISQFESKTSTYASVNYDVFEIVSTDYHNELFSRAFALSESKDLTLFDKQIAILNDNSYKIDKKYKQTKSKEFACTLCTYVRHQIHHPGNLLNKRFTDSDLLKSIKVLILIIDKMTKSKKS